MKAELVLAGTFEGLSKRAGERKINTNCYGMRIQIFCRQNFGEQLKKVKQDLIEK